MVEVKQGLAPDDVVVTAGQLRLRDGLPVAVAGQGEKPVVGAPGKAPAAPGAGGAKAGG
jgi:hypothetical protein